ncbi:class I SAM-dependent methyltransferase [Piscinibacter sp.]|uniref:class I SAM-dependent methyltransferase n=1 Tax=Piscinibacter sp. TaxID=1903157 RepID=UPI001B7B8199|nr:class I SAM-dependent methyltransferase [Piscinibacter sp.]MBP5991624.1 class I SAM-dependent methyltransferase [Piscinibacter sp.]MBP6028987.1 class I SAM-dependent methyltransferase [Piscinibacter sp.]
MNPMDVDRSFTGSIPQLYEQLLVPLIFAPYADDLARRAAALRPASVLELAAGTGVVTRALSRALPAEAGIVASDLNQPMLDHAATIGTARPVRWQQADALELPFADGAFDLVVCQFGVMFFADKPRAFAEARRVLRKGGTLLFSAWDRIEVNELAHEVSLALETLFPADPPRFMARTPHGYHDKARIAADLAQGGFASAMQLDTVAARSIAASAREPAVDYCQGTPWRNEIEARSPPGLNAATQGATEAIERRFGNGRIDAAIQAHVVAIVK